MSKFSAYLSVYNDWDLLAPSLASMREFVDELVVVDGAYDWMVPFVSRAGLNPARSQDDLYNIIDASGIPFRVIEGPWPSELAKRQAGYEACTGQYIYRLDADEVIFMRRAVLDRFLASGGAVAEMEVPISDSPDRIHVHRDAEHLPRVGFLFDRAQIDGHDHLRYLWIVSGREGQPTSERSLPPVFGEAIAFAAHLTTWRRPQAAAHRAAFYILNWVRQSGYPWIPSLSGAPLDDIGRIFDTIPAERMLSSLSRHDIANGHYKIVGDALTESPLDAEQRDQLRPYFEKRAQAALELNEAARRSPQGFLTGWPLCFDVTDDSLRASVTREGMIRLEVHEEIGGAEVKLHLLRDCDPFVMTETIPIKRDGNVITVDAGELERSRAHTLRSVLTLEIWPASGVAHGSFRLI